MATRLEEFEEENKSWGDKTWDAITDFFEQTPPEKSYVGITGDIQDLLKNEDATKKDYYTILNRINEFQKTTPDEGNTFSIDGINVPWGHYMEGKRMEILDKMDEIFPDRGVGTKFKEFEKAYAMDDPEKQKAYIDRLRANQIQSPHKGNLKDNLDVKTALAVGAAKRGKEETPYEGPFGKLGEYFSKNADAREKLFAYIGEMGKELVKPVQPGQAAAGALVPTLSRGLDKGEKKYEEARAAEAKMMKDLAQAQKDANPLQFYTNKMKEARYMAWNNGIDPDSAEGTSWIGNWLQTQGVASGAADLSAAIKSMSEAIMQETDPDKKKDLEKQRDRLNEQLTAIVMQSSGGGYSEEVIDYDIYKQ
jgi:hypothetical protein